MIAHNGINELHAFLYRLLIRITYFGFAE